LRLAEVPGYGVASAQQVIAEVGPAAATFPSPGQLSSWVGICPGREESAAVSKNNRSPKGNQVMRRVLNQVAHAAVKTKGSIFQALNRRLVTRLGHNKAIWAIAHRLCRLTWKILHPGARYTELGPDPIRGSQQHAPTNLFVSFGHSVIKCNFLCCRHLDRKSERISTVHQRRRGSVSSPHLRREASAHVQKELSEK